MATTRLLEVADQVGSVVFTSDAVGWGQDATTGQAALLDEPEMTPGALTAESATPGAAPAVDVRLLGTFDLVIAHRPVALKGSRARKLFALLALNSNTTVPFQQVIDVLWDEPPASARQQVHNVVAMARQSLPASGAPLEIVTTANGYQLNVEASAVDVFRFRALLREAEVLRQQGGTDEAAETLRRALAEWRGPALHGLGSAYLANMATTLDEQRLTAVEQLSELKIGQHDTAAMIAELMKLVAENPFRESLRAILMEALFRSGRRADALAVFEDGRRVLRDELGLDPGAQLQAAQQLVLTSEAVTQPAHADPVDATCADEPHPRRSFLPRDIAEFTGRESEVRQLVQRAAEESTALIISAIDGMGGMGKTTLAVHLAHRLADHYPDGQYFVDLHGFSPGAEPLAPEKALSHLLRSNGTPPELIPRELADLSALWRAQLANRKALLLLDNAANSAQVRPLLPGGPGTLVLISSRRRMASLEGAVPLSLDVMPPGDAMALFERVAGPERVRVEPEAVREAVELCGCLPLAIQIVAARLKDRPTWSLAYLVEQLRDQRGRARLLAAGDRDVMDVLAWSYRHLTPAQQTAFCLLALHPGRDFDAAALAALAAVDPAEAVESLESLFDLNLVREGAAGRYNFHDLVHDCSQIMLERDVESARRKAAVRRLVDYYVRSADLWCASMGSRGFRFDVQIGHEPHMVHETKSHEEAIALLESEHRNFIAVVRLAADSGYHAGAWQLACALLPYLHHINYGPEIEPLLEQAQESARVDDSPAGESIALFGLAMAKRAHGALAEARPLVARAIDLCDAHGDREMELIQRIGMGTMCLDDNLFDDALAYFNRAMDLAIRIGDRQSEADLTNNLGVIFRERGDLDEALKYFRRTLTLDQELDAPRSQALTISNIAQVLFLQRKYVEASVQFENGLQHSRLSGSRRGEMLALIGLCSVHRWRGSLDAALRCGREALTMATQDAVYEMEGDALSALGDAYLSHGDIDMAERVFQQAADLAAKYTSDRYRARALEGRAHVLSARGDIEGAAQLWEKALQISSGGVVNQAGAMKHLVAPTSGAVACWRCERAS